MDGPTAAQRKPCSASVWAHARTYARLRDEHEQRWGDDDAVSGEEDVRGRVMVEEVEEWRPVVGHEGKYEVSSLGRVRSLDRVVRRSDGHSQPVRGRILRVKRKRSGHLKVTLPGPQDRLVHHLVLEAFVGPRPDGLMCRHLDGDPTNNRPQNLAWGTDSENKADQRRHGTHHQSVKTHCPRGHLLKAPNLLRATKSHPGPRRGCLACSRAKSLWDGKCADWFKVIADRYYGDIMAGTAKPAAFDRTHCPRGHALAAPNLTAESIRRGHRSCLACARAQSRKRPGKDLQAIADAKYAEIMSQTEAS